MPAQTSPLIVEAPVATAPALILTPPEEVKLVVAEQVPGAVPLKPEIRATLDKQRADFVKSLLTADVRSEEFRKSLDSAFSIGRKEIAQATTLSNEFTKKGFTSEADSPAYKAIAEMRALFDELNPAQQGDLFQAPRVLGLPIPTKVLGVTVPFGNKLKSYLRRYESAERQFSAMSTQIEDAKTTVQRSVSALGTEREKMWAGLEKLESVVYFIAGLDNDLTQQIEELKTTSPDRARALEQEVLYYVRQNLGDVRACQALTINAYNVAGELRKTGRETINGCDRLATLGMAALSVGVTMARATGVQIQTQKMLSESKKTVHDLIAATGDALKTHVQATVDFANDPIVGIDVLQNMFNTTNEAMDILANFRTNALAVSQANNAKLADLVEDQMRRISAERQAAAPSGGISL